LYCCMSEVLPAENPLPSQAERTMAVLAHALQMVGLFIAPLVIFVVRRQSRFVSFHALQALIFQVIYVATTLTVIGSAL